MKYIISLIAILFSLYNSFSQNAYNMIIRNLYDSGNYSECLITVNNWLYENPSDDWSLYFQGLTYMQLGSYISASQSVEKSIEYNDSEKIQNYRFQALGIITFLLRDYEKSLYYLNEYKKKNPHESDSFIYILFPAFYASPDNYAEALDALLEHKNYFAAEYSIGLFIKLLSNEITDLEFLKECPEDSPALANTFYLYLGFYYRQMGNNKDAVRYLKKCIKYEKTINFNRPLARFLLKNK